MALLLLPFSLTRAVIRALIVGPVRLYAGWAGVVWAPVDETLPDIGPPYPEGSPDVALTAGFATLSGQQAQLQTFDVKNSLAAVVTLTVTTLAPAIAAVSDEQLTRAEVVLGAAALVLYTLGFVVFWRDWWIKTYLGGPEQESLRNQAAIPEITGRQLGWAAAVSIEQAIVVNDRHISQRVAAFKLLWTIVPIATTLALSAIAARII